MGCVASRPHYVSAVGLRPSGCAQETGSAELPVPLYGMDGGDRVHGSRPYHDVIRCQDDGRGQLGSCRLEWNLKDLLEHRSSVPVVQVDDEPFIPEVVELIGPVGGGDLCSHAMKIQHLTRAVK